MAEGGLPGRGRGGRGAFIARLLEMQRKEPPSPSTQPGPSQTEDAPETPQPPRAVGRGAMFAKMTPQPSGEASPAPAAAPVPAPAPAPAAAPAPSPAADDTPKPKGLGRGRLMQSMIAGPSLAVAGAVPPAEPQEAPAKPEVPDKRLTEITREFQRIRVDNTRPPVVMRGTSGREFEATANFIRLYLKPGVKIHEYEVRLAPPVDERQIREELIFRQHGELLGRFRRTFDGVTLYAPIEIPNEASQLTSVHPVTKETHVITLKFRRERSMGECEHLYNVLFGQIQRALDMTKFNREYFSQHLAIPVPRHNLEVWPGYVTAVAAFEGGIMLQCNSTSKIFRTQTVYDRIMDISGRNPENWKDILYQELVGTSVMIREPVKMYTVHDIDFDKSPADEFMKGDGTSMTYIEYHRRKGITIRDPSQPLLVHKPKPSKRPGGSGDIVLHLIPELCQLTGLTDNQKSDFHLMKDIAIYTRINPNQRQLQLQKFINNIRESPACVKILDDWGLRVPEQTVELTGRVLPPEMLVFGRGTEKSAGEQADWGRAATSEHMLEAIPLLDWLVLHVTKDERNATGFIEMMGKVCPQMGVQIEFPIVHKLRDDRTETYTRALQEKLTSKTQVVVIIFPTSRDDRYASVKKELCCNRPVPSQVINSRTISKPDKLRSIVQKIALQINCKLGGSLWGVKMPLKKLMICGMDSHHDKTRKGASFSGLVSSMNQPITKWYSQVFKQSSQRELLDSFQDGMFKAITKYNKENGFPPDIIFVYRDGVGDGQLDTCKEFEIASIQKSFQAINSDYNPELVFIVCQKRIITRIFTTKGRNEYGNPNPGSVLDHTITRRYEHDFYLVSQLVRQGTVTPTHYIVLHNTSRLDSDKLQKMTYKMCHLYYNWPGTIRVPAPCQYAHKLAFLAGTHLHRTPNDALCDKLFFL